MYLDDSAIVPSASPTSSRSHKSHHGEIPPSNPLEPRTWSKRRKWYLSILLALLQFSVYHFFRKNDLTLQFHFVEYLFPGNSTNASRMEYKSNCSSSRHYRLLMLFLNWTTSICANKRDNWTATNISIELDCVHWDHVSNRIFSGLSLVMFI